MNRPIILLFILALVTFAFPTTLYHYFPAVSGQSGTLVKVVVSSTSQPGLFIRMPPDVGISLQDSLLLAKRKARLNQGVVVSFVAEDNITDLIDGPSGGALFTTLFYALAHNQTIRHDAIMTGTVNKNDSSIGPVGGLYEKVCAAAHYGYRYFVMPPEPMEEYIGAMLAAKRCKIMLLQANTLQQAIDFMVYKKNNVIKGPSTTPPKPEQLPTHLVSYGDENRIYLKNACLLVTNYEEQLYGETKSLLDTLNVSSYYKASLDNQKTLMSKGYFYTAANTAFVNSGVLNEIKAMGQMSVSSAIKWANRVVIQARHTQKRFNITTSNIDWVMSAQARSAWAELKAEAVRDKLDGSLPLADQIGSVTYLTYAELWERTANYSAHVADLLAHNGTPISRVALKRVALRWEHELSTHNIPTSESWHYYVGEYLMSKGQYAGALFCFAYVMSTIEFNQMLNSSTSVNQVVAQMNQLKFTHAWPIAYASQAAYLSTEGQNKSALSIYLLAKDISQAIDEVENQSTQVNETCVCPKVQPQVIVKKVLVQSKGNQTNCERPVILLLLVGGALLLGLIVIFYFVGLRKSKK